MKKRRSRRAHSRDNRGHARETSLGSGLDEIGFRPLGRRIAVGTTRGAERLSKHRTPSGVHYDRSSGRIVIEFNNGSAFAVPARSLQGLADVHETSIAEVELIGETRLRWERSMSNTTSRSSGAERSALRSS